MNYYQKIALIVCMLFGVVSSAQDSAWPGLNLGTLPCAYNTTISGTTVGAADDCSFQSGGDHIWQFTTAGTYDVEIHTCNGGTGYDTKLYLYNITNGTCGNGSYVATNDDGVGCGLESRITQASLPAGTYVIVLEGFSGSTGAYDMTIDISNCPTPMAYSSAVTTQSNTSNVQLCQSSAQVLGLEVVTTGATSPIDLTRIRCNLNGTTVIGDVSNVEVYYTGTTGTFSSSNLFGTVAAATGTLTINGTQTLASGTNYFWVVYDLSGTATVGNVLDGRCAQVRVDGADYGPAITNPAGDRPFVVCSGSPGGVSTNIRTWLQADNGAGTTTDGTTVSTWTDDSGMAADGSGAGSTRPVYRRNTADNVNFNPGIEFDGTDDYLDLVDGTIATNGDPYSIYAVAAPGSEHVAGNPGKIVMAGEYNLISSANLWVSVDVRSSMKVLHGFNQNDLISADNMAAQDEPVLMSLLHDFSDSPRRESHMVSTMGSTSLTDNPTTNHSNDGSDDKIGMATPVNEWFDGLIQEIVIFNGKHTTVERYPIESYLAIKYGLTLDHDYIASDGTSVIWDISANSGYNSNIAGIGRDDGSGLQQKQSKSENANTMLTVGHSTSLATDNFTNANAFGANNSFFIWGDNGSAAANNGSTDVGFTTNGVNIVGRMDRVWKSQETGTVGTIILRFDMSTVPSTTGQGNNDLADVRLLMDANGTFASGAFAVSPSSFNNTTDVVEFQVDFTGANGFFFTLGTIDAINAPLPVELVSFTGHNEGSKNILEWYTASEINNKEFVLERSVDGYVFETLGNLAGAGTSNSPHYYTLPDNNPNVPVTYYRLKIIDYDGGFEYSETISIAIDIVDFDIISIFPNPTQNNFSFIYDGSTEDKPLQLYVVNAVGAVVLDHTYTNVRNSAITNVHLDGVSAGIYQVVFQQGELRKNYKLVITE